MRAFEASAASHRLAAESETARRAAPCCEECGHKLYDGVCRRHHWCPCHDVEIEE